MRPTPLLWLSAHVGGRRRVMIKRAGERGPLIFSRETRGYAASMETLGDADYCFGHGEASVTPAKPGKGWWAFLFGMGRAHMWTQMDMYSLAQMHKSLVCTCVHVCAEETKAIHLFCPDMGPHYMCQRVIFVSFRTWTFFSRYWENKTYISNLLNQFVICGSVLASCDVKI